MIIPIAIHNDTLSISKLSINFSLSLTSQIKFIVSSFEVREQNSLSMHTRNRIILEHFDKAVQSIINLR